MRRSECYSGCEGKALTAESELTGDRGSAFIVNLLCDFIEELLGGLCQQLCGSQRLRSGLRGDRLPFTLLLLCTTHLHCLFFPKVLSINKVEQTAETRLSVCRSKNAVPVGHYRI